MKLRSGRILLLIGALSAMTFRIAGAQAAPTYATKVTLFVPVQMHQLDPHVLFFQVKCDITAIGANIISGGSVAHSGQVAGGHYGGTMEFVFNVVSSTQLMSGQGWTYQCVADYSGISSVDHVVPGTPNAPSWAALASTSGPNLISGSFTSQ